MRLGRVGPIEEVCGAWLLPLTDYPEPRIRVAKAKVEEDTASLRWQCKDDLSACEPERRAARLRKKPDTPVDLTCVGDKAERKAPVSLAHVERARGWSP